MSKISKVVLYKHGVGYFERKARVDGNTEVRIGFRAEEMNDVLKSLTVFDSGGGTVNSVSYDNQKPISKLLEEISLDIPQTGGGASLLGAVRGARVQVTAKTRMVTGQVIGVEERLIRQDGATAQKKILSVFDDTGALHSFDMEHIISVGFQDEHLKNDLKFFFETLLSATKDDTKNLKLFARGEGERELSISYVVECPVWKTSYRMALPKSDNEKPYLQGWALVDNPQDEDWEDVELSLVSGLPISFTHDLYSPRYLKRKEIQVERESAAGPVMAEEALFDMPESAGGGGLFDDAGGEDLFGSLECEAPMPVGAAAPAPMMRRRSASMASSQKPETVTQKVGQLFEYRLDHPVTVLRNQSALVPIVGDEFEGERKLFYNQKDRADNPFAVIDFKNTTGLTLEGGPLTVYEGEVYAGEAMLDTLGPDEERMVPYAVELGVSAKVEGSNNDVLLVQSLDKGVWLQKYANYAATKYRFVNKGKEDRTLVLEHAISDGELVNTPKPVAETKNYWRFSTPLPGDQTTEFVVTEKTTRQHKIVLKDYDLQQVIYFLSSAKELPGMKEALVELQWHLVAVNDLREKIASCRAEMKAISGDQKRLRENLSSLGQSDDENRLRSRYVAKLESQEDRLNALRQEVETHDDERQAKQLEFYKITSKLSLEKIFES